MKAAIGSLILIGALASGAPAWATEVFGGVYAHDLNLGISVCCYEHGADIEHLKKNRPA